MDWFLYGRDLRHERVKLWTGLFPAGSYITAKAYSEPCRTSKMDLFPKINGRKPWPIFAKYSS